MYPQRFSRGQPQNRPVRHYRPQPESIPVRARSAPSMNYQQRFQAPRNRLPLLPTPQRQEMINNITQTIMQVQNQQQQWQMERQQQNMHRNQELQQQWQMERQQQNMHRNQELQKEWLMERQQQVNMCRNQVEELEQQWLMARQRQERMHWDKELQQQWQMERQQEESRHMNQERERREQTELRPEEDQWARMHHEHLWRKKWKPTDRKDHNIMVKVNTEKKIASVTKVNQNKLGREMTMTKKSDSDSAKQMPSRCKVESSVKCKNLIDISQNKEKNQSSSEKTVTEIKSTSDFKDDTREQIKQESVEKLSSVDDKTCESNDESSQDKKSNNCKKLNNDVFINKAHGAEEKETKPIPCKIELDGSTNSLGDRRTSNDDANAKLPKAPEVDKKAEIKDRFKYHANQQKKVRSPGKDNQNNHDELDKGLADAEDAMYKEEINETKVQLEKLTLTPKVNAHSESTLSREDLSKHISDTETNDIKNSLTQHVELKAQSILMKKDKCSDDQKTGLILEKVKEQDVAECKLSIKGPSDTIKATDHVQCLKKCESETKENSLANDVSDTSGADNKICSSERHGSEPTGESHQNRDGSGNISKQEGEHTTNNIEQNSRIEDSSVERIPVTTSVASEHSTQPSETDKINLPNKPEPILFVDKAIETSINDNQSAGNTSKDIHSVNIGKVSDVKLGEEKHLEEEDIEELAGRISEILSESGNKEQYEVVVEDISDDEKGDRKEGKIKTGTSSASHKDSADGPSGASFIEKSVAILSSLSPNSGNKTCSGLKVNNETEKPSKIVTENEITVNENTEPNNAFGETEDLHNAVRENTDLDNKTADEIEASLDLSGAGLEEEETNDREKSYLECMEVEDISPPLSLGAEPAANTDTNDTVGNSYQTCGVKNLPSCNSGSTIPSDFKMKSGTYHNIFTLLEKNRSETSVDSLPINEGGDASLSPLNVKENSNTLEADQDKALQTDLIDKESDLIDKESQDLHLVLEDDNNSCSEGMEDTLKNVADSKDRNSFVDYITSSGPHSDVEEADNRAESPENEEKERPDSEMQANSVSGIAVQQDKVKAGSVESSSIDGLPATVSGSVVDQQTGREQSDEERKENQPPGVERDFSVGDESDEQEVDSDNDLFDVPAFLHSVKEVSEQALPSTPELSTTQSQDSNTDSNEASEGSGKSEKMTKSTLRSRFSLDDLLDDKEKSTGEDQLRLEKIHSDCKKDIAEGGFITILDRVDEEGTEEIALSEEKQEILNQLTVVESQIREDRPGRLVLDRTSYCCLFGHSLHPTHCGFTVGGGKFLEKHLQSLKLSQYERLVTGGLIQIGFEKIQCKEQLLRWLFFLMSIHSDYLLRHGCHRVLMDVLHAQQLARKQKWSPAVADVLSVFVNYGASLNSLCSSSCSLPQAEVPSELYHQPGYTAAADHSNNHGYAIDNLLLVLEILAYGLKDNSCRYTSSKLTLLLSVLMKVSLDTKLESFCAFDAFYVCVGNVIRQYTETDWNCQKIPLCRLITQISSHHHDRLVLVKLLPLDSRGSYLQRRTSYLMLEDLCSVGVRLTDEELHSLKIQNLYQFVGSMKEMVHTDPYKLSSVISLLDLGVGHGTSLTATDREELRCLMDLVKRVSGEVRDNVRMLDRTRVKDMMFRVANRWSLNIQATRGKQSKMFEFVKPDSRREIQTVQTVQSNEESEDSDSSQDSEDDQEEAPCKMPRLEPFYFSPNTTNPAAVADCTAASGFSTMISDNSTCTVRSDNSVVRSDNSAVRSDSRAVRPNSNAVRNLSESLKSDIQHRTSMENGDLEQPDGTSLESSNTENIAIDDQSCVGERGDIVSGSPDDHFDIRTSSLSARPTETSMDYDDDNELPEL